MATAPTPAMGKTEIKALLTASKSEPVTCAIGLNKDKQAMILLHKTKAGMALVKDLEKIVGPLSSPCHGTAAVDEEVDAKLVILTLNKAPGGIGAMLKKTLAAAGYLKIQVKLEDGTVAEAAGEEDAEAAGAAEPPAAPAHGDVDLATKELVQLVGRIAAAAGDDAGLKARLAGLAQQAKGKIGAGDIDAARTAMGQLREAMAGEVAPGGPDLAALKSQLAGLVGKVPTAIAADPAAKATLIELANRANASLKGNDPAAATGLIERLREALVGPGPGTAPQGSAKPSGRADPAVIWRDAKELVGEQISRLQDALRGQQHPMFDRIADQGLNGVTGRLQVGLQVALTNLAQAEGEARVKAALQVKSGVADFRTFLNSDKVVPLLESNPLGVAVKLRATLIPALDAIERALAA